MFGDRIPSNFNISMFGHQTVFDDVWSPNIYRLSRTLQVKGSDVATVTRHVTIDMICITSLEMIVLWRTTTRTANQYFIYGSNYGTKSHAEHKTPTLYTDYKRLL